MQMGHAYICLTSNIELQEHSFVRNGKKKDRKKERKPRLFKAISLERLTWLVHACVYSRSSADLNEAHVETTHWHVHIYKYH